MGPRVVTSMKVFGFLNTGKSRNGFKLTALETLGFEQDRLQKEHRLFLLAEASRTARSRTRASDSQNQNPQTPNSKARKLLRACEHLASHKQRIELRGLTATKKAPNHRRA